jgi:hypothetical protein
MNPTEWRLITHSFRQFCLVIAFFVFAVLLDMFVRFCEHRGLVSTQLINGMEETAWFIFQADRFVLYFMVTMSCIRFVFQFTSGLWSKKA